MKPVDVARAALADVEGPRLAVVTRGARASLLDRLARALPGVDLQPLDLEEGMDSSTSA